MAPRRQSAKCIALSAKSLAQAVGMVAIFFTSSPLCPSICHPILDTRPFSFDDSVRKRQHLGLYSYTNLFGGLKIDHQLELCWLLHRELSRLGAFEDLIYEVCRSSMLFLKFGAISHKASNLRKRRLPVNCRETVL